MGSYNPWRFVAAVIKEMLYLCRVFKTQDNLDRNRCPINKVTLKLN